MSVTRICPCPIPPWTATLCAATTPVAPGPTTPAGCASWPTWPPYVLDQPIQPGTAVRIMTGAPVPPGTEAVVPFEEVERDGDEILIFKGYPPKT